MIDTTISISMSMFADEIDHLRSDMRECDYQEIAEATNMDPVMVAIRSLQMSPHRWVARVGPIGQMKLLALFGVTPKPDNEFIGFPWMIGTNELDKRPTVVLRNAKKYVTLMRELYPMLENWVHADNIKSIRMLEHLGFIVEPPEPWGANGKLYRRFHWENDHV